MMSTDNGNSASKRPRNREVDGTGVDRISELPLSVLLYILSFLPILYVVRTSALSRRWQYVWTGVPCLEFGAKLVRKLGGRVKAESFINRVLLQYKATSIHRFSIGSVLNESRDMELWIRWAISRKVEVLGLSFAKHSHLLHHLPLTIFGCKTLVALRLKNHYVSMVFPPSACIPCLKILELESLRSPDVGFERKLISSCVVLENLYIRKDECGFLSDFRIHAQHLKRLRMRIYQAGEYDEECAIDINAPNLENLDIKDDGLYSLLLENVGNLRKAKIDLNNSNAFKSLLKCFSALKNVESLYLSSSLIKQACNLEPGLAVQNVNLTRLRLEVGSVWVQLLPCLFDCFPNLQVLILKKDSSVCKYAGKLCTDPKLLPTGLLPRLEVFAVEEFCGTIDELGLLKYILKNGRVLDLVQLSYLWQSQNAKEREGTEALEIEERL